MRKMETVYEILISMGATGSKNYSSVMGKKEPIAHPCNCKCECPYGYGRAMCFPCLARIMSEHSEKKSAPMPKG